LPIYREIGDRLGEANCQKSLGDVHVQVGEYAQARERYGEALPIYREIGDRLGEANTYRKMATLEGSPELYERALAIHAEIGARNNYAVAAYYYGILLRDKRNFDAALYRLAEAQAIWQELGVSNSAESAGREITRVKALA